MELSKENIQFIDTYLEKSNIIHADIRMEMVDHVATSIELELVANPELSFYKVFKTYMINNKAILFGVILTFIYAFVKTTFQTIEAYKEYKTFI